MILKTKEFQDVCKTVVVAVDTNATNLELLVKENSLYLNVTNREYFVSVKFALDEPEEFHAVVDAELFLNLISGLTTETFELKIKDNIIMVKAGKSNYKLAMIYENDHLMQLPPIVIENKTVEMAIENDILKSIINTNSKELVKVKNIDSTELQKLYYITEDGAFTFTDGACLNSFKLEKPIKILLNSRIVKLFKLFKEDVDFSLGYDTLPNGIVQTKISLESTSVYLAAIITNDEILLNKVQGPCTATKNFINTTYTNRLVLSVNALSSAIARLMLFTKNSISSTNMLSIKAIAKIENNELTFTDRLGNSESITIENGSYTEDSYEMIINLSDIKLVLDSCKDEHITMNCGNHRSVVLTRGNISNLIPEREKLD